MNNYKVLVSTKHPDIDDIIHNSGLVAYPFGSLYSCVIVGTEYFCVLKLKYKISEVGPTPLIKGNHYNPVCMID